MRGLARLLVSVLILGCGSEPDVDAPAPASPAAPTGYCQTVTSLAGAWVFDTTVIGAQDLGPRGINGHYEANVTVDGCNASVELRKTGYDTVRYPDPKIQVSTVGLSESKSIPDAAEATFSLDEHPTHTMTFVVRDGQLFGFWQSTGHEWERAGMWGFLRGVRSGQDLAKVEDFAAQPCEVACLTQCDAPRRRADASLAEPQLAACLTACASGQAIDGCGATAMPAELLVEVHGPRESFDAVCQAATAELIAKRSGAVPAGAVVCDRAPQVDHRPAPRNLTSRALAGSFASAELVQVGGIDSAYFGELILLLETDAGWFWTEPLVDLSNDNTAAIERELSSLVIRARDLLSPVGREVQVEIAVRTIDVDQDVYEVARETQQQVVVCSVGAPPTCVQVPIAWSSKRGLIDNKLKLDRAEHPNLHDHRATLHLAILPGDLISISAPPGAREQDLALAQIYAWPVAR